MPTQPFKLITHRHHFPAFSMYYTLSTVQTTMSTLTSTIRASWGYSPIPRPSLTDPSPTPRPSLTDPSPIPHHEIYLKIYFPNALGKNKGKWYQGVVVDFDPKELSHETLYDADGSRS